MNRIRQGWDALRRGRRSGVSLVIALCAVAVLIGLSLSIVYSSSMLLSRANRKIGRERCYQLAQSFAQVLDSELTAYNTERTDLGGADDKWPQTADGSRTFYQYANSVLENLDAYDADDPEHTTYYYSAGSEDDDYGKVTVMLRKQNTDSEQNPADRTGRFPYAEKDQRTAEIAAQTFIRYQLSVSVRVEKGRGQLHLHDRVLPPGRLSADLHLGGRGRQHHAGVLGQSAFQPEPQHRGPARAEDRRERTDRGCFHQLSL